MFEELLTNLRLDSIRRVWMQLSVLIAGVFGWSVIDAVCKAVNRPEPVYWLVVLSVGLTVFVYVVGDAGVHRMTTALLNSRHLPQVRQIATRYLVLDVLLATALAGVLAALGWYSTRDVNRCLDMLLCLSVLDILWLIVKLKQFIEAREQLRDERNLHGCIRETMNAMLNWIVLNAVFAAAYLYVVRTAANFDLAFERCVYLGLVRSMLDLALCARFYSRVLAGDLPPNHLCEPPARAGWRRSTPEPRRRTRR